MNIDKVKEAMTVLEQANCGEIGSKGPTLDDLQAAWNENEPYSDDAYDTCQHAWRLLEEAIKEERK